MLLSFITFYLSIFMFFLSLSLLMLNSIIFFIFPLIPIPSSYLSISLIMDWMSFLFSSSVCFISSAIMMFSYSYIPKKEHKRFSIILLFFIFSMILLIFSNNIFFLMLGWDGLGLSSFILVIYYLNSKATESGIITILSNRMGDITILLAIGMLSSISSWEFLSSKNFPFSVFLLISIAAMSKSAQSPFSAWLPAAMAAPTPISALVHSSTLVTAGTYLMIRTMNFNHPWSMFLIMISSSMTMFWSGLSANWEQDMKKIIALSTLSQIGMIMFSISINSPNAAFFHLITHAMFKSTIFLCAGTLIHNSSYQDMRKLGNSMFNPPIILTSLSICSMALMGLPFMSGFFSKDLIIETLLTNYYNLMINMLMFLSIGLTASYSTRMISLSTNSIIKSPKDTSFNIDIFMLLPILLMTPLSIFLGAMLSWTIKYPHPFIIPTLMKILIPMMIITGMTCGSILSFKSKYYQKLGEPSISLWFLHFISCKPTLFMKKHSSKIWTLEKSWLEISSAQGWFNFFKNSSKYPDLFSSIHLMMISIFLTSSIMFLSI